jgi:Family of unknown function (DUF5996)
MTRPTSASGWPELPLDAWEATRATLHMWSQMVGKTRLALSPMENHWWQVALYVSARGLTTSAMPYGEREVDIEFDLLDHRLVIRTSDGGVADLRLEPVSVAEFYERYLGVLAELDVHVRLWSHPVEIATAIPFPQDETHASYDAKSAERFWRVLTEVDRVFKTFRGRFVGKSSPVHFWWGSFDLAHTRFSGRPAPRHPGGIPNLADWVTREAYSHECMSVGWWPGNVDGPIREPAFYAYGYPEPPAAAEAVIRPASAAWVPSMREWVLPYDAVRLADDPDQTLLAFAEDAYEAVAVRGKWDRKALER